MTELARRRGRVQVGNLRFEDFRISFRVQKSVDSSSNACEVSLFSLNETSRNAIETQRKPALVLDAGYELLQGAIFVGEAIRPRNQKTPTGWVTTLEGQDGHTAQRRLVNVTLGAGATVAQVIQTLASAMGVSAASALSQANGGAFDGDVSAFQHGITLSGSAKSEMDSLMASLDLEWSIQDGELVITEPNSARQGEAVVLSPDSGLLGFPEFATDEKRPNKQVLRIQSLLNARLKPGGRIVMGSAIATGQYKILSVTHTGDTFGNLWQTQLEAVEVAS